MIFRRLFRSNGAALPIIVRLTDPPVSTKELSATLQRGGLVVAFRQRFVTIGWIDCRGQRHTYEWSHN